MSLIDGRWGHVTLQSIPGVGHLASCPHGREAVSTWPPGELTLHTWTLPASRFTRHTHGWLCTPMLVQRGQRAALRSLAVWCIQLGFPPTRLNARVVGWKKGPDHLWIWLKILLQRQISIPTFNYWRYPDDFCLKCSCRVGLATHYGNSDPFRGGEERGDGKQLLIHIL